MSGGDGPDPGSEGAPEAGPSADVGAVGVTRPWRAMSVCFTALFMTLLDVSVVNVALPSMGHSTDAGPAELQWVVSGYVLAFGLVPVLAGRVGDQFGRRPVFLLGVAGFVVTSALVGLAPNAVVLLAGRFLQGLTGGVINPQVAGFIQELFHGRDRGRAFGALGTLVGVATALGPVIGGLLIGVGGPRFGWRLVFFVNIPIGLVALVLSWRWLPPPRRRAGAPARLDVVGAGILGTAVLLVMLAAIEYGDTRRIDRLLIALPALVVVPAFLAWERRMAAQARDPLVDLRLFTIRSYAIGVAVALVFFCAFPALPLVLSLFFQDGLGYSALWSGLSVTPFAVGSAIAAGVSGRLVNRFGRRLTLTALAVLAVGVLVVELSARLLSGPSAPGLAAGLLLAPSLFVAGLGSGGVITPNQTLSLAEIDARGGGVAAGMLQTAQRIGSAVGTAVVGAVFFAAVGAAGRATVSRGTPATPATREAFAAALGDGLLVTLAFVLLALVLAGFEVSRPAGRRRARRNSAGGRRPLRRDAPGGPRLGDDAATPRRSGSPTRTRSRRG